MHLYNKVRDGASVGPQTAVLHLTNPDENKTVSGNSSCSHISNLQVLGDGIKMNEIIQITGQTWMVTDSRRRCFNAVSI